MYGDIEVCSSLDGVINTYSDLQFTVTAIRGSVSVIWEVGNGLVFSYVYQQHVSVLELNNSSLSSQVFFLFFWPFWVPVTSRHGEYVCRTV